MPRELLVPATVTGLVRMALAEWACIVLCWGAMARWPVMAPLAVLVIAGRIHALGVVLHDAVHLPLARKSPSLWCLEALAGYPIASTWEAMRYHHLRHHRDAGLPTDPYRRKPLHGWRRVRASLVLTGVVPFWVLRGPMGLLAWAVPALRKPYARLFLQERQVDGREQGSEVRHCARAELGQVMFHLGVLALVARWPAQVAWGYGLPLLLASALNAHRLLSEHTSAVATGRTLHDVLTVTSDHGLGWLGRLWLAPRNVGCHVVHHLHPQVSLTALPRLREWYVARFPAHYPPPQRP